MRRNYKLVLSRDYTYKISNFLNAPVSNNEMAMEKRLSDLTGFGVTEDSIEEAALTSKYNKHFY